MAKIVLINKEEIAKEISLAGWHASVSYDSNTDHTKIANHCVKAGHGTPTRGMRFIFEISEVSRAFSHEFVRHEQGVYKVQRSQRYVNEDGFVFVIPPSILNDPIALDEYCRVQQEIQECYVFLVSRGIKPEDARYILSNATHTKIHVIMNWEGLDQFCYRRCCTRAQWEIRNIAFQAKAEVTSVSEFLGNRLGAHCSKHGYCPELPVGCGIAPSQKDFLDIYSVGKEVLQKKMYKLAD